ncbi:MAG: DUF429 domain-containing protein [Solirubrobacteraceae bacterium]|nr:DUF429 domain-containing protein [Solirubrobacteraceae bacterium]
MHGHHVIAVDWSGRADARHAETIWAAEVIDGRLTSLQNGRTRDEVVAHLIETTGDVTVGFDFSFSMPAWWFREQGWIGVEDAWRFARDRGEALITDHEPPFFGRAGSKAPPLAQRFRRTELTAQPAKSIFQLAGAGAVGVGSLRGMPHLLSLREAGFAIWPFDAPGPRTVVEIYPRLLIAEPVDKGRWAARRAYLRRFEDTQDPILLERAAGSEDAFDAVVSALAMATGLGELAMATDLDEQLEGRIWRGTPA